MEYRIRTWDEVAAERGVKVEEDGSITGAAYAAVGVHIINGCPDCGACVAPYNSWKISEDNDFPYCRYCADVEEEEDEPCEHPNAVWHRGHRQTLETPEELAYWYCPDCDQEVEGSTAAELEAERGDYLNDLRKDEQMEAAFDAEQERV